MENNNFTSWRKQNFGNTFFARNILMLAARYFNKDQAKALAFLEDNKDAKGNLCTSCKCDIISQSSSFDQFSYSQASNLIQEKFYSITKEDAEYLKDIFKKPNNETQLIVLSKLGIEKPNGIIADELNKIISNAISVYFGVEKKNENKNEKEKKRIDRLNEIRQENGEKIIEFKPKLTYDEFGYLIEKPGVNHNIRTVQGSNIYIYNHNDPRDIVLPDEYKDYAKDQNTEIQPLVSDRSNWIAGTPGYVAPHYLPENQPLDGINSCGMLIPYKKGKKELKKYFKDQVDKANNAIVAVIISPNKKDIITVDLRAALRDARRRGRIRNGQTYSDLLDLFSDGAVVHPSNPNKPNDKPYVSFSYKQELADVFSQNYIYKGTQTNKKLLEITKEKGPVCLISVDLNQRQGYEIVSLFTRVWFNNETNDLEFQHIRNYLLPDKISNEIIKYRNRYDASRKEMRNKAISKLTTEQQAEILARDNFSCEDAKRCCINKFKVYESDVQWPNIHDYGYDVITIHKYNGGDKSLTTFDTPKKKNIKLTNYNIYKSFIPKLSEQTYNDYKDALYKEQRNNIAYQKLSKSHKEFCRRVINLIKSEAEKLTGLSTFCWGMELLEENTKGKKKKNKFQGRGASRIGWNNFGKFKSENRYFINGFKSSMKDDATNHGSYIMEGPASYTSQRCRMCNYIDSDNRNGDEFHCKNPDCIVSGGHKEHADINSTYNICNVIITGKRILNPNFSFASNRISRNKKVESHKKTESKTKTKQKVG